ncbi:hypothetical protein B0I35DRAFT_37708 [Stachybotrys elegans]|uniref:Uncharacterized protein n=1 Tax=Stachybotrys elegans TaxID=80388 RepID=A0A8K0WYQ7_9HYPO|nr:hypothetical protein B0I35DRAFT_37708 [Stachybotrys elegans]
MACACRGQIHLFPKAWTNGAPPASDSPYVGAHDRQLVLLLLRQAWVRRGCHGIEISRDADHVSEKLTNNCPEACGCGRFSSSYAAFSPYLLHSCHGKYFRALRDIDCLGANYMRRLKYKEMRLLDTTCPLSAGSFDLQRPWTGFPRGSSQCVFLLRAKRSGLVPEGFDVRLALSESAQCSNASSHICRPWVCCPWVCWALMFVHRTRRAICADVGWIAGPALPSLFLVQR